MVAKQVAVSEQTHMHTIVNGSLWASSGEVYSHDHNLFISQTQALVIVPAVLYYKYL